MKFSRKILLSVIAACLLSVTISIFIAMQRIKSEGEKDLVEKSRAILSRLEAVRSYVALQGGLDNIVQKMTEKYPDGNVPREAKLDILKQVPIFASMKVGSEGAEKEHYSFRVFSNEPRNPDNKATASEMEIFNKFEANPELAEQITTTENEVIVYRPVRLSESQGCLRCHGNPQESPWKNGKDILGHQMEDWKDKKLHGVFAVASKTAEIKKAAVSASMNITLWAGGVSILIIAAIMVLLRGSLKGLSDIAQQLRDSGEKVSTAGNEISRAAQSLSVSTTQAAASIETTTASTEEVASMIKMNASHAGEAKSLSESAQDRARVGREEVTTLISSMDEIAQSSKKIEEIISVIDDIAFQTNLLALNAAVEAARAGEQGKGFAVVADAVRSLAQRSATSAKEISDLIKDSVSKIGRGYDVAQKSGESLHQIVTVVEKVNHLNTEISVASQEQSQGVDAINKSINELDKVTQSNAASAEESAAASEELSQQSQRLHQLVTDLNQFIDGKTNKAA